MPGFPAARQRLLPLAAALAALPQAAKARLEDADSNYNVGWSHGKEALDGGKLDSRKGSFYANPCRCDFCLIEKGVRLYQHSDAAAQPACAAPEPGAVCA